MTLTLFIPGLCNVDKNPFGPDHEYVAPETVVAERLSVDPSHSGPLLLITALFGIGLITTEVEVMGATQHFL
ncbi:MAG: hypothetical protein NVS3B19_10140 [Ginsengibacter sp.]